MSQRNHGAYALSSRARLHERRNARDCELLDTAFAGDGAQQHVGRSLLETETRHGTFGRSNDDKGRESVIEDGGHRSAPTRQRPLQNGDAR